jgi:hypothetical protein
MARVYFVDLIISIKSKEISAGTSSKERKENGCSLQLTHFTLTNK